MTGVSTAVLAADSRRARKRAPGSRPRPISTSSFAVAGSVWLRPELLRTNTSEGLSIASCSLLLACATSALVSGPGSICAVPGGGGDHESSALNGGIEFNVFPGFVVSAEGALSWLCARVAVCSMSSAVNFPASADCSGECPESATGRMLVCASVLSDAGWPPVVPVVLRNGIDLCAVANANAKRNSAKTKPAATTRTCLLSGPECFFSRRANEGGPGTCAAAGGVSICGISLDERTSASRKGSWSILFGPLRFIVFLLVPQQ